MKPFKIKYDRKKYHFRKAAIDALGERNLEKLHDVLSYGVLERSKDQSTVWHQRYYGNFETYVQPVYKQFIEEFIKPSLGLTEIIYQKIPTFRAHLVDNLGVGEWHRDRDYNHGKTEINIWLPFTDTYETNTIWLESEEGKEDYEPYSVMYGEVLVFDGANLMHGNKVNKTMNTRVSVDFRVVDPEYFTPSDKGSINMNSKFNVGGYFEKL